MPDDLRFMSELFRIISGALRLDVERVRNYTAFLADKLEDAGDKGTAARLRKMLEESDNQLRPAGVKAPRTLPVDSESRFPLLERFNPKAVDEPPIVLSDQKWALVREFISIAKSLGQMESHGLQPGVSMLMYGPPGTGKSRLARYLARELGFELYTARLDGLISSFLGSTSKNIRALFEFASRTPCVLFLDEFDALAKLRGDTQELGELKRVVNSFLQNLDTVGQHTIILAATNHEELLDKAVWRRFTYRLEFRLPGADLRAQMWSEFLQSLPMQGKQLEALVDLSEGFSGSDIQGVSLRLQRKQIAEKATPDLSDAFEALRNIGLGEGDERKPLLGLRDMCPHKVAQALRDRDERLYSSAILARLLGVSKSTALRWAAASESDHA